MGRSEDSVPAEERVAYYRAMAAEALHLARSASDEAQKASYLDIATRWNALATEVERQFARDAADAARGTAGTTPRSDEERR